MVPTPLTLRSVLKTIFYGGVLLVFFFYIVFQSRLLLTGPVITLINEPDFVQNERTVTLEGTAENIVNITINGRAIATTQRGYFKERVILENGYTSTSIEAEDRYGRTTAVHRTFIYTPISTTTDPNSIE